METFTMSRKEVPRAGLLKTLLAGKATNAQGAAALGLSIRQVQRLKVRFQTDGARGLLHRSRGRPAPPRLAGSVRAQIDALLQTRYKDFNDCHATEKLREVEGLPAKHRRRPKQHRHRRTPAARRGQLAQVDGSPFAWLEGRGPTMTLLGAIDDATSTVLALHFRPTEDLHGYAVVFQQLFTQYGLPLAVYGDRINILVRNDAHWSLAEQLQGAQTPTHLGRVLADLGIGYLAAGSPEAKGRIERLWRTLQDRLTSELRLRRISTLEAANAFLPEFLLDLNRRFTRVPADPAPAWRPAPRDLALLLSCRYTRQVARDNTVHLGPRWIQIPAGAHHRSYAGCRVELRELLDGRLVVLHDTTILATQAAPGADFVLKPRHAPSSNRRPAPRGDGAAPAASPVAEDHRAPSGPRGAPSAANRRSARPGAQHPWRRAFTRKAR